MFLSADQFQLVWAEEGEFLAEVVVQDPAGQSGVETQDLHPVIFIKCVGWVLDDGFDRAFAVEVIFKNIHFVLTARIEYTLARGAMSIALIYSPSIGIKCGRSLNKTNSWRKDSITFTSKIVPNPAQTRNVMLQSPWNMDKKDAAKFSAHSAGSGSAGFASNKRKAISISKRIQITGVMRGTFSR